MPDTQARKHSLLQQYEICVEMADRVSQRRDSTNRFFASFLTTATVALLAADRMGEIQPWIIILACAFGLLISWTWVSTLQEYKKLNKAKFQVILAMEKELAWACFGEEHRCKKSMKGGSLTDVEKWVPRAFAVMSLLGIVHGLSRLLPFLARSFFRSLVLTNITSIY